jgi:hypothetical protein
VNFGGLNAIMPNDYPSELINYSVDDLRNIGLSLNKKSTLRISKKSDLNEIIDKIYAKYPSFDKFEPKNYKPFFPKLTEKEILENSSTVLAYIEKLMAYEVADLFSKEGDGVDIFKDKRQKNARPDSWVSSTWKALTQCESWYYVAHLRMSSSGLLDSKDKALHFQKFCIQEGQQLFLMTKEML